MPFPKDDDSPPFFGHWINILYSEGKCCSVILWDSYQNCLYRCVASVSIWSSCNGIRELNNHLDSIFFKCLFGQLVEAFHATLEEVVEADLLVVIFFL